eukprot:scaffold3362_cov402-Prasinococcus_capsulatus_cf.AAC.2
MPSWHSPRGRRIFFRQPGAASPSGHGNLICVSYMDSSPRLAVACDTSIACYMIVTPCSISGRRESRLQDGGGGPVWGDRAREGCRRRFWRLPGRTVVDVGSSGAVR